MRSVDLEAVARAKMRGRAFVLLFQSAKQLVDNYPGAYPYLEYDVREIEKHGLAPRIKEASNGRA